MASTTYTVRVNGADTESRSKKSKAVELAEIALANDADATVEVVTQAGTIVWPEAPEATADEAPKSTRTAPYTRTDQAEGLPTEVDGYELAYTRPRVNAGVYRSGKVYLVVQFDKDGAEVLREDATNTKEARFITNRLADEHRAAQAEAKAAEAEAKAEAKAAKDAEREAKRIADEEAKAAKLAAKEAEAAADAEAEAELVEA